MPHTGYNNTLPRSHIEVNTGAVCFDSIPLWLSVHTVCLKNRQVGFGGNVDDGLVAEVGLLAHPKILDVGGCDAAVFNADGFGGTLGAFDFGLCVELLGFEVGLGLLYANLTVLLGVGKFCTARLFLLLYVVVWNCYEQADYYGGY